jgi:hypothetical protein
LGTIKGFYELNEFQFGRNYKGGTPYYYASLRDGFDHYFDSVRDVKNTLHLSLDGLNSPERLSLMSAKMMDNIGLSILAFHRFFELFIKDLLSRVNPFFSVKVPDNKEEYFRFFDGSLTASELKTVEFATAYDRLKGAFKYYDDESDEFQIIDDFRFLTEQKSVEALAALTRWRNRIMHNGKTLPNCVSFDFLISQQLIPIISSIIAVEQEKLKDWKPHYFKSVTGINIIDRIRSIEFEPAEFSEPEVTSELKWKYLYLAHLKEIGRALFTQDFAIRNNVDYWESSYENPIGRVERFADLESSHEEFFKRKACNCCNTMSLVVYRKPTEDVLGIGRSFHSWFKCFHCGYSLSIHLGDPFDFGLSEERVFT